MWSEDSYRRQKGNQGVAFAIFPVAEILRKNQVFNGQANGLQCRTLEILGSFGFGDRASKEANHMLKYVSETQIRMVSFSAARASPILSQESVVFRRLCSIRAG
ncbi:hypothetical protein BJX64DRAFT_155678 [Aspergillus heterothallicus]